MLSPHKTLALIFGTFAVVAIGLIAYFSLSGGPTEKELSGTMEEKEKPEMPEEFEDLIVSNDGKNELVVSTRGDNQSENITSEHLGHVFMYSIEAGEVRSELIVDLDEAFAESSWVDVGDADNDGKNEVVLATGKGDRTKPGKSYVLLLEIVE